MNRNNGPHSSLVLTPEPADKLFSSQHSEGSHPSPKPSLQAKALSDRPRVGQEAAEGAKMPDQPTGRGGLQSEAVEAAVETLKKLKCREKIRQNQERLLKFKQKFAKMLTSSGSTAPSNPSSHSPSASQKSGSFEEARESRPAESEPSCQVIFDASLKEERETIELKGENGTQTFRILKYVSEGTSGKVFLAQHLRSHCIFSIKVIPRAPLNQELESQLFRELKIQSYLHHPNIVRLYHFFVDPQNVYLLLEPCLGNDLFKNLKERKSPFTEKEVREVIKQVSQAVEYMHKKDIIHRDIKPENILMHEKVVKICDFGWAVHSPLLRDTRCGTPIYSSPEMIKKELYDNKIDVWNVGVLTYELLYATIPFEIRQLADLSKIVDQKVYFSKQVLISDTAKDFISGCMRKDPADRYTIRQAIDHQFMNDIDKFRWTIV